MKFKIKIACFILATCFIMCFAKISSLDFFSLELVEGKNNIIFNVTNNFDVETLIKLNPEIEAVTYKEGNQTFGYVNFLEGIGENFIISNREYEIISNKNISLEFP